MFDLFGSLIPNPGDIFKGFVEGKLEKEAFAIMMSVSMSGGLTMVFESGKKKLWGEGPAMQKACASIYAAAQPLIEAGYLKSLAVPKDLIVLSEKFQTESKP